MEKSLAVTKNRGLVEAGDLAKRAILTVHPSYLLRLRGADDREAEHERFVNDLRLAVE